MNAALDFKQNYLLNLNKVSFQKRFGQNFLYDDLYAKRLVEAAKINKDDIVIEIGTGLGVVTNCLKDYANQVITYEIDSELFEITSINLADFSNISFVNTDILQERDISESLIHILDLTGSNEDTPRTDNQGYKVVSSLPYNISKKVIKLFLDEEKPPLTMTFIIQEEVARDYSAKPPKASFLSNYINLYGKITYIEKVPKEEFYPVPKVDGAIIHIEINKNIDRELNINLAKFIKSGFSAPRKTILNVFSNMLHKDKTEIERILKKTGINPMSRAENLELNDWRALYTILKS